MYKLLFVLFFTLSFFGQESEIKVAETFQNHLNKEYADSLTSPLMAEDLVHFKGLDFYPITSDYVVSAKFVITKKEKPFKMKTSTARTPLYKKYGTLYFELEGKQLQLNVYQNIELSKKPGFKDYLFLPFSDLTNGKESYIGGRYIDFRIPKSDTVILNFNLAYNPYCAYNYKYSCPIVPLENDLDVAIKAGVKKFHD